jgi:TonB family protein
MRRELLLSFAGHAVAVAAVALIGAMRPVRETRRPIILLVSVVSPGSPLPQQEVKGAAVVEPKPQAQPKPESKPQPKVEEKAQPYRRQGLGARIEGAEALGYSYYLNIILTRISGNWANPYLGQARKLTATVDFVIERDGQLREVKLEKSSGDRDYDESCVRALLVTDRLPPLPPEFAGPRLRLHLEFEHTP